MNERKKAWNRALHATPAISLPPASNENGSEKDELLWEIVRPAEPMPLMFRIDWAVGRTTHYAYSDLRIVDVLNPGEIVLSLFSMEKLRINVTGRHLGELANLLSLGRILSFKQSDPRELFELLESAPAIEAIVTETLTGP